MTNWLKWRLGALLGTALLVGSATYLHAQSNTPPPPKTPEEAGVQFFRLLSSGGYNDPAYQTYPYRDRGAGYYNSISRPQIQGFSNRGRDGALLDLLLFLTVKMHDPQYEGRVSGTEGAQTFVEVSPSTTLKNRPVVVIAEDGGYRVDLKATFAKWNNLGGDKLDREWYRFTGEASPAMLKDGEFLQSQCYSAMRQQMLGVVMYAMDYDEKLPSARQWVDVLQPYVKSEELFRCPAISKGGNGYAYNQYLSQVSQSRIADTTKTINIYETSNPKRNWFGPGTGRAYRHQEGWNLAFADGHVKWFKRDSNMSAFSFLLKTKNTRTPSGPAAP